VLERVRIIHTNTAFRRIRQACKFNVRMFTTFSAHALPSIRQRYNSGNVSLRTLRCSSFLLKVTEQDLNIVAVTNKGIALDSVSQYYSQNKYIQNSAYFLDSIF